MEILRLRPGKSFAKAMSQNDSQRISLKCGWFPFTGIITFETFSFHQTCFCSFMLQLKRILLFKTRCLSRRVIVKDSDKTDETLTVCDSLLAVSVH